MSSEIENISGISHDTPHDQNTKDDDPIWLYPIESDQSEPTSKDLELSVQVKVHSVEPLSFTGTIKTRAVPSTTNEETQTIADVKPLSFSPADVWTAILNREAHRICFTESPRPWEDEQFDTEEIAETFIKLRAKEKLTELMDSVTKVKTEEEETELKYKLNFMSADDWCVEEIRKSGVVFGAHVRTSQTTDKF